jgi:hypothetical protein
MNYVPTLDTYMMDATRTCHGPYLTYVGKRPARARTPGHPQPSGSKNIPPRVAPPAPPAPPTGPTYRYRVIRPAQDDYAHRAGDIVTSPTPFPSICRPSAAAVTGGVLATFDATSGQYILTKTPCQAGSMQLEFLGLVSVHDDSVR